MAKGRAPKGCYWRGDTLYGQVKVCGVKYRFSLGTADPAIARKRRAAEVERLKAIVKFGDHRRTWEEAIEAWLSEMSGNISDSTGIRYTVSLNQVRPYLTGKFVDEIDKALLADIVAMRRAKGVSNATVRRDLSAISSVLKFCEDHDWPGVTNHAALAVKRRVKERRDPIVLPEPADIEAVIAEAPGMLKTMIQVAWKTGCRQEELASLDRSRIDFQRRQATVVGKGNKLRVIDLHDAYAPLCEAKAPPKGTWAFWHDNGAQYREVSNRFFEARRAAMREAKEQGSSLRRFRFHDLRHRFAVDFLKERRGSIYDLQQHLGHTSVRTTEIYLAYLTPEEQRDARQGTQKGTQATVRENTEAKR